MEDVGPLFVVVSYEWNTRFFCRILKLDPKANKYEYVAHFEQPQGYPETIRWVFSYLPCSLDGHLPYSPEDLCMVPDWGSILYQKRAPLLGFVFNLMTKELNPIKPPGGARYYQHVVDLGGDIYFMGAPKPNYEAGFFFASYNRLKDSWKILEDFPYDDIRYYGKGLRGLIVATAVWNNTILLTMDGCGMWVYDVHTNKWYPVSLQGFDSDEIVGNAVVLGDTIYALAKEKAIIFALSIKRTTIKGGLEFKCSQLCRIYVSDMDVVKYDLGLTWLNTMDFVHLGGDNFCIVQSCNFYDDSTILDQQPILVTYLKIHKVENSMTVEDTCVHYINLLQNEQFFRVELCFTLPEDKATAFEEGNRFFSFDPFPEHYVIRPAFGHQDPPRPAFGHQDPPRPAFRHQDPPSLNVDSCSKLVDAKSNVPSETSTISSATITSNLGDGNAFGRSSIDEEDHSLYVRNLPLDATHKQLEKGLKNFGSIKRVGILVDYDNMSPIECFGVVEFENATSKQNAIKASSPILIGDCQAVIEEKTRTSLTLADAKGQASGRNNSSMHAIQKT